MFITGIVLSLLAIRFLCWLWFVFTFEALSLFIGAIAGALVLQSGASAVPAILVGASAGVLTSSSTKFFYAATKSPFVRAAIVLLSVGPATVTGYHTSLCIARIIVTAGGSREALALMGAFVVGCLALDRLSAATRRTVAT